MWYRNLAVAIAALAALAVGCRASEPPDASLPSDGRGGLPEGTAEEVAALVEQAAADHVGGVLAVVDTPDGALAVAAGMPGEQAAGDLAAQRAFRIASSTKMVTAAVVLQLVEEGAFDLDDPLPRLVPARADAFAFGDRITLRHMLGHTSGVRDFIRHPDYLADLVRHGDVGEGAVTGSCEDLAAVDPFDYAVGEALFAPGTDFAYSNTGYLLAGEAIEAATGQPLEEVYRERILDPLDLEATWLACDEQPRAELVRGVHAPGSFGFTIPGQGDEAVDVTDVEPPHWWAAGGLVATAEDLAVLTRALLTGGVFDDDATVEALLDTSHNPAYGLGVEIHGDDTYGHGGLAAGYGTQVLYDAAGDTVVVVLVAETAEDRPGQVAGQIMRALTTARP